MNATRVMAKFSVMTIDKLLDELGGASIFSILDVRVGYHHIQFHSRDSYKTILCTYDDHFEFLVMSFGHTNVL